MPPGKSARLDQPCNQQRPCAFLGRFLPCCDGSQAADHVFGHTPLPHSPATAAAAQLLDLPHKRQSPAGRTHATSCGIIPHQSNTFVFALCTGKRRACAMRTLTHPTLRWQCHWMA
jgi:hypothetical protein